MDNFVINKLKEWDLENLITLFEEEEISEKVFGNLSYESIKELVKKTGPRVLFWQKFKEEYIDKDKVIDDPVIIYSGTSESSSTRENISFLVENTDETLIQTEFISLESCRTVNNYLKCCEGTLIKHFNKQNGFLDNSTRSALANVIVYAELGAFDNEVPKISSQRFKQLTIEICREFTEELPEIYYSPYNKNTKSSPSGKLFEIYNYVRKKFKRNTLNESSLNEENNAITTDQEVLEKVSFLEKSLAPWDKVIKYWSNTRSYRQNILLKSSIKLYFDTYPVLKDELGYQLLLNDFDKAFPEKSDLLFNNWDSLNEKLIAFCQKKKSYLELIEKHGGPAVGFVLLPAVLSVSVYKLQEKKSEEKRAKRIKLSISEVQNSFIRIVQDTYLILESVNEIKKNLQKDRKTFQPLVIVVGDNLQNIKKAFVIVEDTHYQFDSLLNAVDTTFKIFHTLNAKYPQDCEPIWTLLQQAIYDIHTPYDKTFSSVSNLLAHIKKN